MRTLNMPVNRGEDKPLLVSMGRPDMSTSDDDKYNKSSNAFKRWKYAARGGNSRGKSMVLGAASVIKSWPDHLTMCWLTAVGACFVIIIFILALESTMSPTAHQKFSVISLQKQCVNRHEEKMEDDHDGVTNVYLHVIINEDESFFVRPLESIFEGVEKHHPDHMINIFVLRNDTFENGYKRNARFKNWELYHNQLDKPTFFDTSSGQEEVTAVGRRNHWSHDDMRKFDNINIVRSTFSDYFLHSPLRYKWRIISPELIPFVLRVLTLWEHGGITMPWPMFKDKTSMYAAETSESKKLKAIVQGLKNKHDDQLGIGMSANELLRHDLARHVDLGEDLTFESSEFGDTRNQLQKAPVLSNKDKKAMFDLLKTFNSDHHEKDSDEDSDSYSSSYWSSSSSSESRSDELHHHNLPIDHAPKHHHTQVDTVSNSDTNEELQHLLHELKGERKHQIHGKKTDSKHKEHPHHANKHNGTKHEHKHNGTHHEHKHNGTHHEHKHNGTHHEHKHNNTKAEHKHHKREHHTSKKDDIKHKRIKRDLRGFEDENLLALNLIPKRRQYLLDFPEDTNESFDPEDFAQDISYLSGHYSSEYESRYYSDYSHSGLNAPNPFKTHTRKRKKRNLAEAHIAGSSFSSDFIKEPQLQPSADNKHESLIDLNELLGSSTSEEYFRERNYYREEKAYIKRRAHELINVFAKPHVSDLVLDRFGYYFSTRKPCHAFLGELISSLQSSYNLKDVENAIKTGLSSFCKGRKYNHCVGIDLL